MAAFSSPRAFSLNCCIRTYPTSPSSMKERVKVTWTSSRVISKPSGLSTPTRATVTCTLLPFGPLSTFTASVADQPLADSPSTWTIRSPGCRPTRAAGVFGNTFTTVTHSSCVSMLIPSPP